MKRRPPRSTRTDTLFPYTTLFRSGAAIGRDDEIGAETSRVRLHQNMNPLRLAAAAGRIPHRPTRRIAGGDRNNAFARLQGDVGHSLRRGIEPVERAVAERIDLDGIDERSSLRLLDRRSEEHTSELQSLMRISYAGCC